MKNIIGFYVGLFTVLTCAALVAPWVVIGAGAMALLYGFSKGAKALYEQLIKRSINKAYRGK